MKNLKTFGKALWPPLMVWYNFIYCWFQSLPSLHTLPQVPFYSPSLMRACSHNHAVLPNTTSWKLGHFACQKHTQVLETPGELVHFNKVHFMLLLQTIFQAHTYWVGEAAVACIGEHHVLIQFPLINQAGNSRTSSAIVRRGTKFLHSSSMAAEARNANTGTEMDSHIPSPLVPSLQKQE